jgi:hypothetical protein
VRDTYVSHCNAAKAVALALPLKNPTVDTFDGTFTCVAGGPAPIFPLASAEDYYRWASSHHVLQDIRVPFLGINAADDPLIHHVPLHDIGNGYVVMCLTPGGGHLGWFKAGKPRQRWTTRPVLDWLKLVAEDVVPVIKAARVPYEDQDGFLKEHGRNNIGCKEIDIGEDMSSTYKVLGGLQGL